MKIRQTNVKWGWTGNVWLMVVVTLARWVHPRLLQSVRWSVLGKDTKPQYIHVLVSVFDLTWYVWEVVVGRLERLQSIYHLANHSMKAVGMSDRLFQKVTEIAVHVSKVEGEGVTKVVWPSGFGLKFFISSLSGVNTSASYESFKSEQEFK